jgi:energy-converting hydrogenase Eha subunit E
MIEMFRSGGVVMWPMLAVAVGILWVAVRTALRARQGAAESDAVQRGLQAILFWGVMSVVLGTVGTVGGLVIMTQAIARVGSVESRLIWGGVGVSLVTLIFGLVIFLLSAVTWFTLRQWVAGRARRAT